MCNDIMNYRHRIPKAGAYFRKGNLPESQVYFFIVEARLCKCGEQHWVRTQAGYWIKADLEKGINNTPPDEDKNIC